MVGVDDSMYCLSRLINSGWNSPCDGYSTIASTVGVDVVEGEVVEDLYPTR